MLRRPRLPGAETLDLVVELRDEAPREEPTLGTPRHPRESVVARAKRSVMRELQHPAAYLFPLRLFIGIGWLRAFAEKAFSAEWFNGGAVATFLDSQLARDAVAFPLYLQLIESGSRWIGWVVIALQLLVGIGILLGTYTNLALLIGIALNANFMLAGQISPSAFYIMIHTVLFVTGAGAIFGVDGNRVRRPGRARSILLVAQPYMGRASNGDRMAAIGLAALAAAQGWFGFAHITDFGAGVFDSGLVFGTVMGLSALSLVILRFRLSELGKPPAPMS